MDRLQLTNAKLPKPEIIIAGFLVQLSARAAISCNKLDFGLIMTLSHVMCQKSGLLLLLLVSISALVSMITFCKNRNYWRALITFVASFLINFSADGLGYLTVHCFEHKHELRSWGSADERFVQFYAYIAFPTMLISFAGILVHFLRKPATPRATKVPDPELLLLGVCAQFTVWHAITIFVGSLKKKIEGLCIFKGIGSWTYLLAISGILAILTCMKTTGGPKIRKARAAFTFIASLALNLLSGGAGRPAIVCLTRVEILNYKDVGYRYIISTDLPYCNKLKTPKIKKPA